MVEIGRVDFDRTCPLVGGSGSAMLLVFFDGSYLAYSATSYIRWVRDGKVGVQLLMAKAKVTPLSGLSIPRSELNGLVLASRVARTIVGCFPGNLDKVLIAGDSSCTLSVMAGSTSRLNPYFHNRVGEIKDNLRFIEDRVELEPLQFVPGIYNSADMVPGTI